MYSFHLHLTRFPDVVPTFGVHLARAVSREIRKRAKNVTRHYLLQKHVDKVKLKVRFCNLLVLDVVLETNESIKRMLVFLGRRNELQKR
jgi:hypothetical protein